MIKNIAFRLIRNRVRKLLPLVNTKYYKNLFYLTYKFFVFLNPSQIWIIILALLNKTEFKNLISLPSLLILFNTLLSDSNPKDIKIDSKVNTNLLLTRLEINKFTDSENDWENFFWIIIILAIIKRLTSTLFKLLWIPFKLAMIYYVLNYLGFDLSYIFKAINTLTLGVIDWFYDKITSFFENFNQNDNNN